MPTFPLEFFRAFSHSFCSKAIWAIFHLYVIQIYERVLMEYKHTVHQLSLKYLYLNEKKKKNHSNAIQWGVVEGDVHKIE